MRKERERGRDEQSWEEKCLKNSQLWGDVVKVCVAESMNIIKREVQKQRELLIKLFKLPKKS